MKKIFFIGISVIITIFTSCRFNGSQTIMERKYYVSVWLPDFDRENMVSSFRQNAVYINEINPVWYSINSDGSLKKNWMCNDAEVLQTANAHGIKILPSITNLSDAGFDPQIVHNIISSAALRKTHIDSIAALVVTNGYDGVDLDYEMLYASDREYFSLFVQELSARFKAINKLLSIAVHAKTSEPGTWQGAKAQDWQTIGRYVDEFKIMIYDYHWIEGPPGPISPVSWADEVLNLAYSLVPHEKIVFAMPLYGYDWGPSGNAAVTYRQAMDKAGSINIIPQRDPGGELTYTYYPDHVVYFQDYISFRKRMELIVNKYAEIAGIAFWRPGAEDPRTWQEVGKYTYKVKIER